jgi:hypothetical protein
MTTIFLRALRADDKSDHLLRVIHRQDKSLGDQRFDVDAQTFSSIPGSPFAYWVSEGLRRSFRELPPFKAEGRVAKQGLATGDDFRFVRGWWEPRPSLTDARWFPFLKGGSFSPIYSDIPLVIGYSRADQVGLMARGRYGRGAEIYFKPGITWPARPTGHGFFAHVPKGCIFSVMGMMMIAPQAEHWKLLAVLNSRAYLGLLHLLMSRGGGHSGQTATYEVGYVTAVPQPTPTAEVTAELSRLARAAWSLRRSLDTCVETSRAFVLPALLQGGGATLASRLDAWARQVWRVQEELDVIQSRIDDRCFELYGIAEADRRTIAGGFGGGTDDDGHRVGVPAEGDEEDASGGHLDLKVLAAALVSWSVGVAFGRFDVRLATGEREQPPEPDPFDALPVCSPGMLVGDGGLPLSAVTADYPLSFRADGVLVEDPGDMRDLTAAVRAVFETVFERAADALWQEVAALLDPKQHDLRAWLASSFFDYHLRLHSKSRRKAPIMWQLGTPSGRYSAWLYAHRLTPDSLFRLQSDVVAPKLAHEERRLTSLAQGAGASPPARERKEIAAQEMFVEELRALLDELKRVAPLWKPTLDDGIVLVMAPLWRLVPHKPWQKELKAKWTELAAGAYDWAQLAMHLWPERVVPKCATDRSLAIAHGLEDIFWLEDEGGKWKPRKTSTACIEALVRDRSSTAVEAARSLVSDA